MRAAVPAVDRGAFIPGLKPRGHEDVLYVTARELLATLPTTPQTAAEPRRPDFDQDLPEAPTDHEVVRAFLHRHGHRSER